MSLATILEAALVAVLVLAVPAAALASRRRFDEGRIPRGRELFVQVLAQLLVMGAAALVVRLATGRPVLAPPSGGWLVAGACAAFLGVGIASMPWRWRRTGAKDRERLKRLLPRGRDEALTWSLVCAAAGFSEELAYRGVVFDALARWTGSSWVAAFVAAAAFAAAHAIQGARSVAVIFAMALFFQGLAAWSGSLVPGMLVHAAYDLAAGWVYGRLARRDEEREPREGRA